MPRKEPRQSVIRRARIVFGPSAGVACTIRDISSGGALLEVAYSSWMPRTFRLEDRNGITREAVVVWEGEKHIGVRFTDEDPRDRPGATLGRRPTAFGKR
jgi:hypothetical protein